MLQWVPIVYKTGVTSGTTITSSSASTTIAIPADATGGNPKRLMLQCVSGNVHVKLTGASTTAATASDLMIGVNPLVLDVSGQSNISIIQETPASKVNIVPVEH